MMRKVSLILFAPVLFLVLLAGKTADRLPDGSIDTITASELKSGVYFFASDEMQGREASNNEIASRYLAHEFESMGLRGGARDGSFFQNFSTVQTEMGDSNLFRLSEFSEPYELRQDFFPSRFSGNGRVNGPLRFAGYGITAPEYSYDDYREIDVDGKIAVILSREPGDRDPEGPFEGEARSVYSDELYKILNAQRQGALGLILIASGLDDLGRASRSVWPSEPGHSRQTLKIWTDQVRIPVVVVSEKVGNTLLKPAGVSVRGARKDIDESYRPARLDLGDERASIEVTLVRTETQIRNVLALMPGSDPQLKNEVVILGAHFDHIGADDQEVFNGADDNASGTVSLLEIAEAYSLSSTSPRRSVLFAAWNAEEHGLLGSYYYVERPIFPLGKTAAMLQMDMIGRDEEVPDPESPRFRGLDRQSAHENRNSVNVLGYSYSQDLREIVAGLNSSIRLDVRFRYDDHQLNLLRRSDNWPFLRKGVPILFFNTGLHPDYHLASDTPDKLNYSKMEKIARLVFLTSWRLANLDERPRLNPSSFNQRRSAGTGTQ